MASIHKDCVSEVRSCMFPQKWYNADYKTVEFQLSVTIYKHTTDMLSTPHTCSLVIVDHAVHSNTAFRISHDGPWPLSRCARPSFCFQLATRMARNMRRMSRASLTWHASAVC
eukprot:jgi/Ulvmu1/7128/UM034_0034.1